MTLTQYQMVGLNWLTLMDTQQLNGILGDEMVGSYDLYTIQLVWFSNRTFYGIDILRNIVPWCLIT